jgi:outer membrane protein W
VRPLRSKLLTLFAVTLLLPWTSALAGESSLLEGLYFRVGVLGLFPNPKSSEAVLSDVTGPATLAVQNGPIAGSSAGMGSSVLPALTLGYRFWDQFTVETILAPPPTINLTAGGTLANKSLATTILGTLPTGVPPLGTQLGTTKALPPVLTLTYRFLPHYPIHPYLGAGVAYLYAYDAVITNKVLTQVSQPTVSITPSWGYVLQTGADIQLWKGLYLTGDFKFIGGLSTTATVSNVVLTIPGLPLYALRPGQGGDNQRQRNGESNRPTGRPGLEFLKGVTS